MTEPILAVAGVSKTYAGGVTALHPVDLDDRPRRDLRAARPQRRGQDDADRDRLRHRHADRRHDHRRRPRRARRLQGRAPRDRAGAAGTVGRHVRDRARDRHLQPPPVRPLRPRRLYRTGAARPVAVGQARRQDHGAVGRHEAPRADRQGARARARHPVPRRTHRRRRRGAAPRHVEAGPPAARERAPRSS